MYLKALKIIVASSIIATGSIAGSTLDGTYVCKDKHTQSIHLVKINGETWDTKDDAKEWMKKQMLKNVASAKKNDKTAKGTFDIGRKGELYILEANMISQGKPIKMPFGKFTVIDKNKIQIADMMWQTQKTVCIKK